MSRQHMSNTPIFSREVSSTSSLRPATARERAEVLLERHVFRINVAIMFSLGGLPFIA